MDDTPIDKLSSRALNAMEPTAVADAFKAKRQPVWLAQKVAREHPGFRDAEARGRMLEYLLADEREAWGAEMLARALLEAAADERDESLVPLAATRAGGAGSVADAALDLLLILGHEPTIVEQDALLEAAIASRPPTWATGHATMWLVPGIWAAFLRHEDAASERFAAYFTPEALREESGLQVAASIWMLGEGYVSRHQVTVKSKAPTFLSLDPRWFPLAASLAAHKKLGRLAKRVLELLPKKRRDEVMAASTPLAAPLAKKRRRPKRGYREGERIRMFVNDRDWRGREVTVGKVWESGDIQLVREDGTLGALFGTSRFAPLEGA